MNLNMSDAVVQGLIAAIVQTTEQGDTHGFRLEIRDGEGKLTTFLSDTTMMRSHNDPTPMTLDSAIKLIESAGLRVLPKPQAEAVA